MPPAQTFADFQQVQFMGPVVHATYGPVGTHNDVTAQVKNLQAQGTQMVQGGIHTAIGDPAPGQAKQFCVWYFNQPNMSFQDFQQVQFVGQVVAATYGPAGSMNDFTAQVKNLQAQGRNMIQGGIHTAIGDPAPGQAKVFNVWYA